MNEEPIQEHRSRVFATFLAKFGYSGIAGAVSGADIGILGGAPRNPNLKPGQGSDSSYVRHAEGQYTFTMVHVQDHPGYCPQCGSWAYESAELTVHHEVRGLERVGNVKACRKCQSESWMFVSHMPHAIAARERDRKVIP